MDFILLLVCLLGGIVIGVLGAAAYFRSRYNEIREAVGKGSFEALFRLLDEEAQIIGSLDNALRALDRIQDDVSTSRTRIADTLEWIKNTTTELEALRGLNQMPPSLKADSPAHKVPAQR